VTVEGVSEAAEEKNTLSDANSNLPGSIAWADLTVGDADGLKDFYSQLVGWQVQPVDMGGYSDYCMAAGDTPVAGVCHSRGVNAGLPASWIIYIVVADLDASVARCRDMGGEVIMEPKPYGPTARYCVIRDPAGAVAALYESREQ
jgi:predicted enzyme related to lactoylglutathione lyase